MRKAALVLSVFAGLTAIGIALDGATAQRLRAAIGCDKIEDMPKNISLAELERLCFGTPASTAPPPAAPPPQLTLPPQQTPLTVPPLVTNPQVAAPPPPPPPPSPPPPPPERRFTLIEGRDIDGQDYDRRTNVDLRECMAACRGNDRCRAFAYDKWNRFCFLKDNNPGVFRVEPKAFVAVNSTAAPQLDFSRPAVIQKYQGMEFEDPGYDDLVVAGYNECASTCERHDKCEVFTYFTPTRRCRLIARPGEPFTKRGPTVISGIKRQLPR